MGRLRRFENNRFVGTRDDMIVYDCDDPAEYAILEGRVGRRDLVDNKMVQAFGPDSLPEARNRGFHPR
jgi:hypothetical protein